MEKEKEKKGKNRRQERETPFATAVSGAGQRLRVALASLWRFIFHKWRRQKGRSYNCREEERRWW
jgi:hypothetical protein